MRAWRTIVLAATLAVGTSCSEYSFFLHPDEATIAVGATFFVEALETDRSPSLGGGYDYPDHVHKASVKDASFEDPSIFSVPTTESSKVEFKAVAAGTTVLRVTHAGKDESCSGTYSALAATSVKLTPGCGRPDASYNPVEPYLLFAASSVELTLLLRSGGRKLEGSGYWPLTLSGLVQQEENKKKCLATTTCTTVGTFRVPGQSGRIEVVSPIDKTFKLDLEVFAASAIDALKIEFARPTASVGGSAVFSFTGRVKGRAPCTDAFPRQLTIETPAICSLAADKDLGTTTSTWAVHSVYGKAAGTCRLVGDVPGTSLTARASVEFGRPADAGLADSTPARQDTGWEQGAPDASGQ